MLGAKIWRFRSRHEQASAVKLPANFCLGVLTSTVFALPPYHGYGGLIARQQHSQAGFKMIVGLKDAGVASSGRVGYAH